MFLEKINFERNEKSTRLENQYKYAEKMTRDFYINHVQAFGNLPSFEKIKPYEEEISRTHENWLNSLIQYKR